MQTLITAVLISVLVFFVALPLAQSILWAAMYCAIAFIITFYLMYALKKGIVDQSYLDDFTKWVQLIVPTLSVIIAITSFRHAVKSGADSKNALDFSIAIAKQQLQLLADSTKALGDVVKTNSELLQLVQQEVAEEKRRLSMKPKVEIGLNNVTPEQLKTLQSINIAVDKNIMELYFIVTNRGNARVENPMLQVFADPNTICLYQREVRRQGRHIIRGEACNVVNLRLSEINPLDISEGPYQFPIDAEIPPEVKEFNLHFMILGTNLRRISGKTHIVVQRSEIK